MSISASLGFASSPSAPSSSAPSSSSSAPSSSSSRSQDGRTFQDYFQQAALLRQHSQAPFRRRYDSFPPWYQSTLYASDEICAVRSCEDLEEILDFCYKAKTRANSLYTQENYIDAKFEYEQILGMFNYLVPTDPDWQKKDIDDKRMEERSILRDSPSMNISNEQKKKILELKLSCLF